MKTVTLPNWLYELLRGIYHLAQGFTHNWGAFVVGAVTAIAVSGIAFFYKNHYTVVKGKKLVDSALHSILLATSGLFTALQYAIPYLQHNMRALESAPYIGAYAVSIYAAANFLYALRLKKWFVAFTVWAKKEQASTTVQMPQLPPLEGTPAAAPDSPFEAEETK